MSPKPVPSAFVAGAVLGALLTATAFGLGSPSASVAGPVPPGVEGTRVWVDGEIERFDAANDTLYIDTGAYKAESLPVNVTGGAPFLCTPSDGGDGVACDGRSSWGFVSPGMSVCANLVLSADGAPEAGKTFLNATCGPPIEPAA